MMPLPWHERGTLLGVGVRAYFFDPAAVEESADPAVDALPILRAHGVLASARPQLLPSDGERPAVYRVGALQATPDLVLRHGDGLISVQWRGSDSRPHRRDHWLSGLPAHRMLQAVITAMAVAGQMNQPTVAVWRAVNVLYQFDPDAAVLALLAQHSVHAWRWWNRPDAVTADQLASYCEPRLRALMASSGRIEAMPA